jgi:hypothetical protein
MHLSLSSADDFAGPRELLEFVKENIKEPVQETLINLLEHEGVLSFGDRTRSRKLTHPLLQFNSREMRWQQVYSFVLMSVCGLTAQEIADWEQTSRVAIWKRSRKVRDAITCDLTGDVGKYARGLAYNKLKTLGWKPRQASIILLSDNARLGRYYEQAEKRRAKAAV